MSRLWLVLMGTIGVLSASGSYAQSSVAVSVEQPSSVERQGASFALSGRLAVRDATRSSHVVIEWEHQNQRDDIVFLSPLGSTLAVLHSDSVGAVLETADQQVRTGSSLSELATQLLGMALPIDELITWVQGRASSDANVLEQHPSGRVRKFAESGWIVEWHRFVSDKADARPELLEVSRGDINVRLRIDQWN